MEWVTPLPPRGLDTQWPLLIGRGLEYSKDNPTGSSTPVHPDLALPVERWDTCGRTVLGLMVEPPRFPRAGGICKERGNNTVVHSVYNQPHPLMHDSNQAAPVEWEGNFEDITTWDTVSNYPSVQGRLKHNTEFLKNELTAYSFVRNIVAGGYRLPLFTKPPPAFFKNHASARQEAQFVEMHCMSLHWQVASSQLNNCQ